MSTVLHAVAAVFAVGAGFCALFIFVASLTASWANAGYGITFAPALTAPGGAVPIRTLVALTLAERGFPPWEATSRA